MVKKEIERSSSEKVPFYRDKRLGAIALVGVVFLSAEIGVLSKVMPAHQRHTTAAMAAPKPETSKHLDVTILTINDPAHVQPVGKTDVIKQQRAQLESTFKRANALISSETYGEYGLTVAAINPITTPPDGLDKEDGTSKPEKCYTFDQFEKINQKYADDHHLGPNDAIVDAMTSTYGCPEGGGYAGVYFGKINNEIPQVALQPGSADLGVLLHEWGHVMSLQHMSTIACLTLLSQKNPSGAEAVKPANAPLDFYDVSTLAKQCGVVKQAGNSKVNEEYYSYHSVMGKEYPAMFSSNGIYSTPEFNKLDPQDYPIERVKTTPGVYMLSQNRGELHGVSIALPTNHALRKNDSSLRDITFTVNAPGTSTDKRSRASQNDINVIATGNNMSYDVDSMTMTEIPSEDYYQNPPLSDVSAANKENYKQFGEPILYLDSELGIMVTGGRDVKTGDLYVRVSNDNTPASKEKIAYYKAMVAKRNKNIISHDKSDKKVAGEPVVKR